MSVSFYAGICSLTVVRLIHVLVELKRFISYYREYIGLLTCLSKANKPGIFSIYVQYTTK